MKTRLNKSKKATLGLGLLALATQVAMLGGATLARAQEAGQSPASSVSKSHFSYRQDDEAVWVEPTVDDNDPSLWDGTEKSFSYDQLVNLYTDNPPDIEIDNILKKVSKMPVADARNYLFENAKRIVKARTTLKPTKPGETPRCPEVEHLMCFVMDRGIELADIVHTLAVDKASDDQSVGHRQPGVLAQEVRILAEALNLARDYYKPLIEYAMNPKHEGGDDFHPNYRKFGKDFADKFMMINEGTLNAKAQYAVAFTILGYFQYDLERKTTKGDTNAALRASRGAALILAKAMAGRGMFTPDTFPPDGPGTAFQLLKNIQNLWEAFMDARQVLYVNAPEAVILNNSTDSLRRKTAATFRAGERVFTSDRLTEAWVKSVQPDSDWLQISFDKTSNNQAAFKPVRAADVVKVIDSNGEFKEGDEVADLADLTATGKVVATLENGQVVVHWNSGNRPAGTSTTQLCRYLSLGDFPFVPGHTVVYIKASKLTGKVTRVYSKGRLVVDLGTEGMWRGTADEVKLENTK